MATSKTTKRDNFQHMQTRDLSPDSSRSRPVPSSSENAEARKTHGKRDCRYGSDCFNNDCEFDHPEGWDPCEDCEHCDDFDCEGNHHYKRKKPCRSGRRCRRNPCHFLHPVLHPNACPGKAKCRVWDCERWHPKRRPARCEFDTACFNKRCRHLHSSEREMCEDGMQCSDYDCELFHPPTRTARCPQGQACANYHCPQLHPNDWDPCEQGSLCADPDCPHTAHPADRVIAKNITEQSTATVRKSLQQRQIDREAAALPILAIKDEFCRRLENDRILVVTAETGSGKSTQLPQYLAEHFGGLVVCTQPRVLAAIALARRVAEEYDGTSVGYSVGYRVGHSNMSRENNRVPGSEIVFMTDGTFIRESQLNADMEEMKVLMIDEAHERTLNTDIVLGIAKQMLQERPQDFYVVISSATIVAEDFLRFFGREDLQSLNALGRVYPVTLENIEGKKNVPIEIFAVSILRKTYDEHEGNVLVFLPGQSQIDNAIESFKRRSPPNCIALPLYSALSSEEQDLVLRFNGGPENRQRMVVFCTNIAETSLTINNVRLVIDSGFVYESDYDHESQLMVIESTKISRASAEQRRGRAGRMAPGHCIRLYKEDDLSNRDTKPSILRSSLDLVVLQLVNLRLNPFQFPFMDPPEETNIQASFDLLKELQCIDEQDQLNEKGKLFGQLGVDPRYSAFLLEAYLEHRPILELAAIIVAICVAPTTVFSITGETKEEKDAARTRIQNNAQQFDSDLLYSVDVYRQWLDVALLDHEKRTCKTCGKSYAKGYACGPCRAAYSRTHLLNHKVLNYVESMSEELISTIRNSKVSSEGQTLSDANESEIIGEKLAKQFPERCGELLIPPRKNVDAQMNNNNLYVRLSRTSTFAQRKVDTKYFIATLLLKAASGYKIDRLHQLPAPTDDED